MVHPMVGMESEMTASKFRQEQLDRYSAGDLARKSYLIRRQRKAILEHCRRVAVVGASADPNSPIFTTTEKLLGMGLEILPVFPGRESLLGVRCYDRLSEVPGQIDIVQVYPSDGVDCRTLAREAVAKKVNTFWMEPGLARLKLQFW